MKGTRGKFLGLLVFLAFLHAFVPAAASQTAVPRYVTRTISISSDHPYWNSEDLSWPVGELGATACRVNFSRLEVEDGYDFVILNSSYAETRITGSFPGGCWSDWINGTSFTLRLVTNSYNTAYGFDAVTCEVQLTAAWDTFWMVAIPAIAGIAALLAYFEVRARKAPMDSQEVKKKT